MAHIRNDMNVATTPVFPIRRGTAPGGCQRHKRDFVPTAKGTDTSLDSESSSTTNTGISTSDDDSSLFDLSDMSDSD